MLCLCLIIPLLLLHKPKTLYLNNHNCTDFFSLRGSLEPAIIFLGNPLAQFYFPSVNRSFTYSNSYCHKNSFSLSCAGTLSEPTAKVRGYTIILCWVLCLGSPRAVHIMTRSTELATGRRSCKTSKRLKYYIGSQAKIPISIFMIIHQS